MKQILQNQVSEDRLLVNWQIMYFWRQEQIRHLQIIGRSSEKAVYVDGDDDYLKGLTLTFDLSAYEGDTDYLTIVTLNEDGNFEPVESSLTDNILSCKMDKSGSYCVIDIEEFLGNLGIDLGSYLKKVNLHQ